MSDLVGLFNLVAPFFGMIALGFLCAKRAGLPESGLAWLQFFLIYLALPCLFFRLTSAKPIDEFANLRFAATTTLATACIFALAFSVTLARKGPLPQAVMGGLAGAYSNIGYMGPPLVLSFLGAEATAPVALIFVSDTILLFSLVPALMAFVGASHRRPLAVAFGVVSRIALSPFMLATAAGLLTSWLRVEPPHAIDQMVTWMSNAAAPCALFLLGLSVALRPVRSIAGEVPVLVIAKLLVHPALVWLLLAIVGGFSPVWIAAAIVMAALPPALNIFVVANQYGIGAERASAAILVGTILSMVTLTGILWCLKTGVVNPAPFGR
jgi:malonate transporter